jgi:hypothetical protein
MTKKSNEVDINSESRLYDRLSSSAHFREQYRFVFSATIIATFFIVPTGNILDIFLKWVLGFAMFFAAFYIVCTAASIKYNNPRWMYDIFYISERVRMKSYDIAVDCFAIGLLYFISLIIIGSGMDLLNIRLGDVALWITIAIVMLVLGIVIGLINYSIKKRETKNGKNLDKYI